MPSEILIIGDASSVSLLMAGIVVSELFAILSSAINHSIIGIIFTGLGTLMILISIFIRPFTEGISKIRSTSAWVAICIGITMLVFQLVIYVVDIKGKPNWFKFIRPAGTSTLTCYILPYLLYSIIAFIGFNYLDILTSGWPGIIKSFAVAFFVIWLAGVLERRKVRLRVWVLSCKF